MVLSTSAAFAGLRGPARPSQPAGGIVHIYLGYLIDLGSLLTWAVSFSLSISLSSLGITSEIVRLWAFSLPLLIDASISPISSNGSSGTGVGSSGTASSSARRLRSHSSSIPGSGTIVLSPQAQFGLLTLHRSGELSRGYQIKVPGYVMHPFGRR